MAKQFCFQCGNKLGILMKWSFAELKKEEPPAGMTSIDKICDKCKNNLPKRTANSPPPQSKVVQYKDNHCAVLVQFTGGGFDEFYREFSKLTQEGYELKTTYVPPHSIAGFNTTMGSFFYFQKLGKYSSLASPLVSERSPVGTNTL